jgi:heavy metal sensor kinase
VGGCLVAGWLAKRLSRPLAQLTTTAQQVTSRRLDHRLQPVSGSWEVNQLGQMFDQMLGRLQVAFDKQTRFIADASHELRTPVSVVLAQCEHALYRQRTPEEYRQALEVCLRSSRRMKRLIDDLLFLARADAGRLVLRPVEMDLATAVAHSVELLGPLAMELGVELNTELVPARLLGDPDRLGQVITNLVVNAIRYNRPGGQVVVHTSFQDQSVLLQVRDNGIGIPLEDQTRLFQRFYRADTARTQDDDTGTGLGLSLVYEIVTAHGGTIDVQSAPGEGTTVRVHLPAEAPIFSQSLPETERLPK